MSATISRDKGGRPTGLDFFAQKRANPRRCQPTTVAGFTIASTLVQRDHVRERTTQNARSAGRSRGRGTVRRRTASWWRRTRFSTIRLAFGRNAERTAPRTAFRSATTAAMVAARAANVTGESGPALE